MNCTKCKKPMDLFYNSSAKKVWWCKECDVWERVENVHPIMYPFQSGVDSILIHQSHKTNDIPDISLEILERIGKNIDKINKIDQGKKFSNTHYQVQNRRILRIIWKLGFWTMHDFNEELERKRREEEKLNQTFIAGENGQIKIDI